MRSLRQQLNRCRHFTGISNNADGSRHAGEGRGECKALVQYDSVCTQGKRMILLPCFPVESGRDNPPVNGVWPKCDKCSFKTDAELDAETAEAEASTKRIIEQMMMVRPAILAHAQWPRTPSRDERDDSMFSPGYPMKRSDAAGEIDCPACKIGKVQYRISAYNGHVHAHCSTAGCASWME